MYRFIGSSATLWNAQDFFENILWFRPTCQVGMSKVKLAESETCINYSLSPIELPAKSYHARINQNLCYKKQSDPEDLNKKSRQLGLSVIHISMLSLLPRT